jgi:hypothetical protein
MNNSAAISDAGPTVDDPSIRIEPDSASAAGSLGQMPTLERQLKLVSFSMYFS